MSTERIRKQAESFTRFDTIVSYSEQTFPQFFAKHANFIAQNPYGFGMWIWKPYIILQTLENADVAEGDIVVYCDAGMYLNKDGVQRYDEYLEMLREQQKEILVFSTADHYRAQQFVKMDAVMAYHPAFCDENSTMVYAGVMIVQKSHKTIQLIKDWLELCENYHFLDRSVSTVHAEKAGYCGNDCDNGLFNLVLSKYRDVVATIYPDEINIIIDGMQAVHRGISPQHLDWSPLQHVPFQVRRLTPKFGVNN